MVLPRDGAASAAFAITACELAAYGSTRLEGWPMRKLWRERNVLFLSRRAFSSAGGGVMSSPFNHGIVSQRCMPCTKRTVALQTTPITNIVWTRVAMSRPRQTAYSQRRIMGSIANAPKYEAVVVGAGPAGITCVGNLLERKLAPILWVDDEFNGGRVNKLYREVPSNTKVKMFVDYAEGVAPFRRIVSGLPSRSRWDEPSESNAVSADGKHDKLQDLRRLDPEKGCRLMHAADATLMLTEGLKKTRGVEAQQGRVVEAILNNNPSMSPEWTVRLQSDTHSQIDAQSVKTKRLVLCTGASPNNDPLPTYVPNIQVLDLDTALSPSRLSAAISPLGPTTIAVIGASHSAILVLMNLYNLASSSKRDLRIRWLTRHALRYAEYMDGWILRDNTGLKGEAADWAKANLEPEVFSQSPVSRFITPISYDKGDEEGTFEEQLPGSNFYVQAIGFSPDPIPSLRTASGKEITPYFDHEKGSFNYVKESECGSIGDLAKLPGMYGAGIAWPERVKDPHGNVEMAVGFFKFMKFVKRVVPEWN